jgi:hypothetical protein
MYKVIDFEFVYIFVIDAFSSWKKLYISAYLRTRQKFNQHWMDLKRIIRESGVVPKYAFKLIKEGIWKFIGTDIL